MSKNELIAAAEGTAAASSEWDVRGHLAASLTCWHRLTGKEADELVAMFQRRPAPATQQAGWKWVPTEPTEAMFTRFSQQIEEGVVYVGGFLNAYRCMLDAASQPPTAQAAESVPACWIPPEREGEYHHSATITAYREPMAGWEPVYRAAHAPAERAQRDALPTIKGASITGHYVVVTPAGWGDSKATVLRDAILRTFPVNPAYSPKPDDAAPATKGGA